MTREDIEQDYTIENGIITNPGKFEGEPVYAPYFYDAYLNGMADYDDGDEMWFDITADDRAMFPEIGEATRAILSIDDNGFVYCCVDGEPA